MFNHLGYITLKIFLRDRFFFFSLFLFFLGGSFAVIASEWGVEEFDKIFFDISQFVLHFPGSILSIFWGSKILSDSFSEGEPDLFVSGTYSRNSWLLGKYLGLCASITFLGLACLILWTFFCFFFDFPFSILGSCLSLTFGWLVAASLGFFFGSFCSFSVAFFAAFSLWIFGICVSSLYEILPNNAHESLRWFLYQGSQIFDLTKFLISDVQSHRFFLVFIYGFILQILLFCFSSFMFEKKDLS